MPGRDLFAGEPIGRDLFAEPPGEPDYPGSGYIEPAATFATSLVAEPAAGVTALAGMGVNEIFNFFKGKGNQVDSAKLGEQMINDTREALTYQPKTVSGIQNMQDIGETLAPVGEAIQATEKFTGDIGYELGGESPVMGAIGTTLPTAAITALGLKPFRDAAKAATGINRVQKAGRNAADNRAVDKAIRAGAPQADDLKQTSGALFDSIDESGAVIKSDLISKLEGDLTQSLTKKGYHPRMEPTVRVALDELGISAGNNIPVGRLNQIREFAQKSASDLDPKTKMLGMDMINKIDDVMDNLKPDDFVSGGGKLGEQYKLARDLWGRSRKSELLTDAIEKAEEGAGGFEVGMRQQMRQILKSDKKRKFFSPDEIKAMRRVNRGTVSSNIAKLIGGFGFDLGKVPNILGGSLGVWGGSAAFGASGAVVVPVIGTVSRRLAQNLTRNNFEMANAIVRAGKDGRKITSEYLKRVPKADQSPKILAELLVNQKASLDILRSMPMKSLSKNQRILIKDAVLYADIVQQFKDNQEQSR